MNKTSKFGCGFYVLFEVHDNVTPAMYSLNFPGMSAHVRYLDFQTLLTLNISEEHCVSVFFVRKFCK